MGLDDIWTEATFGDIHILVSSVSLVLKYHRRIIIYKHKLNLLRLLNKIRKLTLVVQFPVDMETNQVLLQCIYSMHIGRQCLSLKIHANIIFSLLAVTDLLTFSGCVYRNSYQQLSPFWTTTTFDREYIQFCQINQISHISHFSPRSASTVSVARSKQREEKLPLCAADTAALISDSLKHQSSLIFSVTAPPIPYTNPSSFWFGS